MRDPAVVELRGKVIPIIDPPISTAQVEMTIELTDGRNLRKRIEHAVGGLEVPMSDADLERKFVDLADGILPGAQARKVIEMCWKVESLASAGDIAAAGMRV